MTTLKKCPSCETEMDVEMLKSFNESLERYNEKGKKLRCPNCEAESLRGLWEIVNRV
jgi:cytochrome c-type biogenesis protein CcmH/NrfF